MSSSKIVSLSLGVTVILCLLSASLAQNELQEPASPGSDGGEELEAARDLLIDAQSLIGEVLGDEVLGGGEESDSSNVNLGCRCSGLRCECCHRIRVRAMRLNKQCCISVAYLKQNYGFLITARVGNRVIFSRQYSVKKPRPLCVGVPFLMKGASICVYLTDIRFVGNCVRACLRVQALVFSRSVARYRLGCFNIRYRNTVEQPLPWEQISYDGQTDTTNQEELNAFDGDDDTTWFDGQPDGPFPVEDGVLQMEKIEQPLANPFEKF